MKKEKEYAVCVECGEMIQGESVEIDGQYYCSDCFNDNYFYCDDCEKIESRDNGYWIDRESKMICEDCCNNHYVYCHDCSEYVHEDDCYYVTGRDYYICEDCRDSGDYITCESCGDLFHINDATYSERYDRYYCDSCYDDINDGLLYSYHEFNDWELFKGKDETYDSVPYYIGKEIELEPKNNYCLEELVDTMTRNINAVAMEDGSLRNESAEIVTHPESWQYLLEHKENYKKFFEEVEHLEYGDAGSAGLHFHVTRPNEDVIARLLVIMESFKDEIKKLSRRTQNQLESWATFLTDECNNKLKSIQYKSTKYLKDEYLKSSHGRYRALNLTNYKTIEFRFFNGANNFEEFWGALQFIHNLMEVALDETRDINTINWKELISGEELENQARLLDVYDVDKYAQDTTEILEKYEKLEEDTRNSIKKTLENFIRYVNREMSNETLENIKGNQIMEIRDKSYEFLNKLDKDVRYLDSLVSTYNRLNSFSINDIKSEVDYLKRQNPNKNTRYFKQIEKQIENYNKEMM